ncbi:methyltransferase domain-containing protein [Clostridium sp. A1-XYC3]|uniref:Methyltransferase domain-containing protein n=1 Tax=Clostridium tanneri TaxID=3037988 RepID=A0ABU4JNH3_9CLOT|nr:methyltransferase domain-containing protein [Clostridium sp. A1-XYC3]MDW8799689.1 methyltransferase domain-containing protein [Clostridium sp. A1-XYC3]
MKIINECRCCNSMELIELIHYESLPVAGLYYDEEELNMSLKLPMTIEFCKSCGHVQLKEVVNNNIYEQYSYAGTFSDSYMKHLEYVAKYLYKDYNIKNKNIIEIGSSNGQLLYLLKEIGDNCVFGYEPSKKLTDDAWNSRGIKSATTYFSKDNLKYSSFNKVDLFIVRHVLEHIDDFDCIFDGINSCLTDNGLLVIEVPSIEKILEENLYSNFFHEHLNYFSETTITYLANKSGFSLIDKKDVNIHGGSIFLIYRKSNNVRNYTSELTKIDLDTINKFIERMKDYYNSIYEFICKEKNKGLKICGYGASHRTTMLLSMSGLDKKVIDKIYDKNVFLKDKYIPFTGVKIDLPERIKKDSPDILIVFAISFEDEISKYIRENYKNEIKIISLKGSPHFIE